MKKVFLYFMFLLACLGCIPSDTVSAHILVTSESGQKGAILHIVPDDDPIAGKKATLFFDTQNKLLKADSKVRLSIQKENTQADTVKVTVKDSLVSADYVFPYQGTYKVRYTVSSYKETYHFNQVVRVTRGATVDTLSKPRVGWAEGLLVISATLCLVLAILFWNSRRGIACQSKF